MLKNFFLVAFRNLLRHRTFSVVNIVGLTLGISCALFIFLIVKFELSYDRYHSNADRIYRVNTGGPGEDADHDMGSPQGLAPILRTEFPEIEKAAAVLKLQPDRTQIEVNNVFAREKESYFVMPEFFQFFDFRWKEGNPTTALLAPNNVVISEAIAEKYFNGDAMGRSIRLNNQEDLIVTGVIEDTPINTDFPFQLAISHATLEKSKDSYNAESLDGWNSFYQTYILLKKGTDASVLPGKFKQMVEKHVGKEESEKFLAFSTQPLSEIHFTHGNFNRRIISKSAISTLQLIGIAVLAIACINFINLASSQSIKRGREVGIRKTLGSTRKNLIIQYLGETFVLTLLALVFSIAIVSQLAQMSKSLTDIPLSAEALQTTDTMLFMVIVLVAVTVFAGFYPAFVLSGSQPAVVLKSLSTPGSKGILLRKGLIAFQFTISQVLIVCTFIVIIQTDYFNNMPLGFNKEAVLTVDLPTPDPAKLATLRNNLLQYPEIFNVSFSLNTPSATINKYWSNLKHSSFPNDERTTEVKFVDSAYFRLFEIPRLAGTLQIEGDSGRNVVVNESFIKEIGIQDPDSAIGERVNYYDMDATIVGVVKDFNTLTLYHGMHPVLLTRMPDQFQKGSVKIDMNQASQAIAHVEKHWKEAYPEHFFTYGFLDKDLMTFYKEERKLSKLLISFAGVAIGIGCIGLLGLIMFASSQRTKEIGIRKIMGASITNIATLLSMDFIVLVAVAGLIAWPIAWYAMSEWLANFANRISLIDYSWVFLAAAGLALLFSLVTVGMQALRAAQANPTESLRNE